MEAGDAAALMTAWARPLVEATKEHLGRLHEHAIAEGRFRERSRVSEDTRKGSVLDEREAPRGLGHRAFGEELLGKDGASAIDRVEVSNDPRDELGPFMIAE